jgi:MHS family proline/betaine transporter-like MFS transporter
MTCERVLQNPARATGLSECVVHAKIVSVLVVFVLIGLMTLSSPAGFVLILEAFKPEVRATSLGIIYALGVTIFGGFAQLIVSALWRMSGSFYAPA